MDLSKAFDTINQDIFIAKLRFSFFKGVIETKKELFN